MIYRMLISALMFSLKQACKITAWRSPDFRARLERASFFMQVNISDDTRCYHRQLFPRSRGSTMPALMSAVRESPPKWQPRAPLICSKTI